jgi:phosphorylcholine metabolism protein LicD
MNRFIILILIVLIILLINTIIKNNRQVEKNVEQPNTYSVPIEMFQSSEKRQEYIHKHLIELLELTTRVFNEFRIPYFIHSGTLLGAVRENNIIPHDDDIDIAIYPEDKDFLLSKEFNDEIKKYNLKTEMVMQKDIDKEIIKMKYLKADHGIFLDIFVFEDTNDRVQYRAPLCRRIWPRGYFTKDEMYPIKKYQLRHLEVNGPNNPIPYLERHYGEDWKIPKTRERNHNEIIKLNETCNGKCV